MNSGEGESDMWLFECLREKLPWADPSLLGASLAELRTAPFRGESCVIGGERGIRTPDTAFGPYNDLANRRLQPLGHLSAEELLRVSLPETRSLTTD